MQKHESGFTLIELMIALAVAAIVLTLGMPSFGRIMERNGLAVQVNDFISSLNYARSEAVKRKQNVVVCRSDTTVTPLNCNTGTGYEDGWLVYIDFDRDGSFDVGTDEIIWTHDALKQGMQFYGGGNYTNRIAFNAKGRSTQNGSFTLCKDNDATKARVLVVDSGRVRLTAMGPNGKAEDSSGTELITC
ncbi:MAG: GspH/FimT family pseudopilin [Gammaproteobacteria bacterium]|nr:GspH/FimT family pseudopilin [Gammaproteobacteria bacterium]